MAQTNEIQVGRFSGLLHKLLAMKEGAPAPTLAPEIVPALALESDRIEWQFLKGEHPAMGAGIQALVLGQLSFWKIANPAASGALVIIERIYLQCDELVALQVQAITAPTAVLTKTHRDTRAITGVSSSGLVAVTSQGSNAVSLITTTHMVIDGNIGIWSELPLVLSPGFQLVVEGVGAAEILVTCLWRERILEDSETR